MNSNTNSCTHEPFPTPRMEIQPTSLPLLPWVSLTCLHYLVTSLMRHSPFSSASRVSPPQLSTNESHRSSRNCYSRQYHYKIKMVNRLVQRVCLCSSKFNVCIWHFPNTHTIYVVFFSNFLHACGRIVVC